MDSRIDLLLQQHNEDRHDEFTLFAIAKEYEKQHDFDSAFTFYNKLKSLNPSYTGLYYHLAKLHEKRNEWQIALRIYEEGIKICSSLKDHHALSELINAKTNLEVELL
jgi:tetratricopeptide (TPR) repeat protein